MKLIVLPGMDGTGKLFQPFLDALPKNIECSIVAYPEDKYLDYEQLESYVFERLPKEEDFVLLAESFSGPIGYMLAKKGIANMKGVFFVATFLKNPNKTLAILSKLVPISLLLSLRIPKSIIKLFFLGNKADDKVIALFQETMKSIKSEILSFRLKEVLKLNMKLEKIKTKAYYIQALNDKLVTSNNLNSFVEISDILKTRKINGPHFILQVKPTECVEFITKEIMF